MEATRERSPAHYHVAAFPIQYKQYLQKVQSRCRSYVVQPGDALARIARRAGTSVADLSGRERPDQRPIYPGMVLQIPN